MSSQQTGLSNISASVADGRGEININPTVNAFGGFYVDGFLAIGS
jgi:hypothetical protein